jgi:group I intron endonuclease
MKSGVYQIRNLINGKRYIGSAIDLDQRWRSHLSLLKRHKHHSIKLQRAWTKHGIKRFVFEVLEECSAEYCVGREQHYLDTLLFASAGDSRFDKLGYNICRVAESTMGRKASKETRLKLSQSHIGLFEGNKNPMWGRFGNKNPMYGKIGVLNPNYGKKRSRAFRRSRQGSKHPNAKLDENQVREIIKLGKIGISQRNRAKMFGISKTQISRIDNKQTWRSNG